MFLAMIGYLALVLRLRHGTNYHLVPHGRFVNQPVVGLGGSHTVPTI